MAEFFGPDDQRRDAYGWLTNQASHWTLGYLATWVLVEIGVDVRTVVLLVLVSFAAWEARQVALGGLISDSLTDFAFVALGSLWGALGGSWLQLVALGSALIWGTVRRLPK